MRTLAKALVATLLMTATTSCALAQTVLALWPEGVPGGRAIGLERIDGGHVANVSEPSLMRVGPAVDRPNGTAVIVAPGGGYVRLAYEREGTQYAAWLSTLGVTTFVLKYRMQEFGHPAPLQDVLRAVRLLRSRAAEFRIDPDRIGVMGSSAGGHLAASAGTLFDHPLGRTGHALDQVNGRPDFLMLMYPVIAMDGPAAHAGSRKALLGASPAPDLVRLMSLQYQVTPRTPPTLLIHTQADEAVPVENSILFYQALTRAKVPAEMYLFEQGGHGMGMRDGLANASQWPRRAEEWLRSRGLLTPAAGGQAK
ncbi:alpha/beta hydrolase [Pseudoduganella chitinolytica]|uniref:Alpha/beta hydrolase n=1 Tax=Pseudoduganella chitinolytica TaxID=34070 RepID=A0ABY8B6U1_9BURK|nr:alpha/beta hydrolase [Pseudoduganella chitinolytica]WEF30726.1 alpha/beta hydrolase [Pseudoduganella chitinolytica]